MLANKMLCLEGDVMFSFLINLSNIDESYTDIISLEHKLTDKSRVFVVFALFVLIVIPAVVMSH